MLRCSGLVRRFGERLAVDGVGFEIAPGETYGLLGPNGSGKTTTISMIAGILRPDAGTVTVAGHQMSATAAEAKAAVGLVPQDIALYEDLTAVENLRFFGRLQGWSGPRLARRIGEVLDVVGLADRSGDRIADFSGGMKRRANIAVGLLHEPELLILDEPTVGVDPQSRNQILDSIERLGGAGLAVLYTTHYMEEAQRLCHRVGVLDDGRMIAEGTQAELVALVGEHDVVELTVAGLDDPTPVSDALAALPPVVSVEVRTGPGNDGDTEGGTDGGTDGGAAGPHRFTVTISEAAAAGEVLRLATDRRLTVTGLTIREPDLEAVFLELTGKALRD